MDDNVMLAHVRRRAGRLLRTLATIFVVTILAVPVAAWASHQFDDVSSSNIFHADIDWMSDNDVTAGCNPPANDEYCPKDVVTREQMAAFMRRLETRDVFLPADPIEGWHAVGTSGEPAFLGDWGNYGGPYREVGFRIDRDGVVHLRGGAARPSDGSASNMFVLPEGYRPSTRTVTFVVGSTNGSGALNPGAGFIEIRPNGVIRVYADTDDRYVGLNGVYFDTRG